MPGLSDYLNKPEYLFRPSQVWRTLARRARAPGLSEEIVLPWGLRLRVRPREEIGRAIWTTGVYDLGVSEVLWRLAEPGETAVDAGANLGYMTSVLASRLGPAGTVYAYEPHPELFRELGANAALWSGRPVAAAELREVGLSDAAGRGVLVEGEAFEANRGTAHLANGAGTGLSVALTTLDRELIPGARIGVLKLDVERHEPAVLRGAERLLGAHGARDVIYEEHAERGEATAILQRHGYTVLRILKGLLGSVLAPLGGHSRVQAFAAPSYLATLDPRRAETRLEARGWQCLRG